MLRTATISIFLSDAKCGAVCRAQTCAHSVIEPSTLAKAFLQGGPKTPKKSNFSPFRDFSPYISETLKIEAYKQRSEKRFISPLSNCRMCLDPSVTWFCRVGGPKMSDAKPVFLISPIVLQPAIVPVSSQRREVRSNM